MRYEDLSPPYVPPPEEPLPLSDAEKDDETAVSEEGLTQTSIEMIMSHTKCTRSKAVRALRECNDDMVNAILTLMT